MVSYPRCDRAGGLCSSERLLAQDLGVVLPRDGQDAHDVGVGVGVRRPRVVADVKGRRRGSAGTIATQILEILSREPVVLRATWREVHAGCGRGRRRRAVLLRSEGSGWVVVGRGSRRPVGDWLGDGKFSRGSTRHELGCVVDGGW